MRVSMTTTFYQPGHFSVMPVADVRIPIASEKYTASFRKVQFAKCHTIIVDQILVSTSIAHQALASEYRLIINHPPLLSSSSKRIPDPPRIQRPHKPVKGQASLWYPNPSAKFLQTLNTRDCNSVLFLQVLTFRFHLNNPLFRDYSRCWRRPDICPQTTANKERVAQPVLFALEWNHKYGSRIPMKRLLGGRGTSSIYISGCLVWCER